FGTASATTQCFTLSLHDALPISGEPDAQFDRFQRSFAFDRRLLAYEIAVDRAWAKALEPIGIFTAAEVRQTLAALDKIAERAKTDRKSTRLNSSHRTISYAVFCL